MGFWDVTLDSKLVISYQLSATRSKYEKLTRLITVSGQNREMVVISESGLYRLVLTSRKPQSEPFQDWVVQEVLPSIRKTGSYSVLQSTEKLKCQVAQLTKDNERLRKNCLNSTLASVGISSN
jgi:prophage antirepressor-like protein